MEMVEIMYHSLSFSSPFILPSSPSLDRSTPISSLLNPIANWLSSRGETFSAMVHLIRWLLPLLLFFHSYAENDHEQENRDKEEMDKLRGTNTSKAAAMLMAKHCTSQWNCDRLRYSEEKEYECRIGCVPNFRFVIVKSNGTIKYRRGISCFGDYGPRGSRNMYGDPTTKIGCVLRGPIPWWATCVVCLPLTVLAHSLFVIGVVRLVRFVNKKDAEEIEELKWRKGLENY
ncbi:hypothetical protein PRIPAC_75748 [Pristionchus pacificus]|uniref:Uncharacterized protein n=1 Tax=Pristionchus pacificus TaxID=54126 RepID=A0A2A6CFG1_PRIPA|nr:hypothetical protein PRIPAC_75748 [Pristionchus pacificus]|eukprot:PDM76817.1 hypothetical protein PRIPAC_42212 [Pristionchus pacificus]